MLLLVSLCLLAVVLVYVGYPVLRPGVSVQLGPSPRTRSLERHQRLLSERAKALAALRELEFERSIGNISEADYAALRQAQRSKAVAVLREIDEISATVPARTAPTSMLDDAGDHEAYLEDRIAGRRRQLSHSQAALPPAPRNLD
jgi:hypothetical protein